MKVKVDGWNNFCRVFELPQEFPDDYCFGGGHRVNFQMVDWFNPVPGIFTAGVSKECYIQEVGPIEHHEIDLDELEKKLVPFIRRKAYVRFGRQYLILYDFGAATVFDAPLDETE